MTKHGELKTFSFSQSMNVNVCSSENCGQEFVLLHVTHKGEVWQQVANKFSNLYCPYCGTLLGKEEEITH